MWKKNKKRYEKFFQEIAQNPEITQAELARKLKTSRSVVQNMVKTAIKRKLISYEIKKTFYLLTPQNENPQQEKQD